MTIKAYLPHLTLLAAASFLAGCAGAPTRFYTVEDRPSAQASQSTLRGGAIRIDAVHIPPAFDRTELVRDGRDGQVMVSDNDYWVAPMGELIRRALTQDLITRLPAGAVVFPDAPKPPLAQGVVVDILAISNRDGALVMQASWTLVPAPQTPSNPAIGPSQPHAVQLSTAMSAPGAAGQASGISLLVGELADHIAADLGMPRL